MAKRNQRQAATPRQDRQPPQRQGQPSGKRPSQPQAGPQPDVPEHLAPRQDGPVPSTEAVEWHEEMAEATGNLDA